MYSYSLIMSSLCHRQENTWEAPLKGRLSFVAALGVAQVILEVVEHPDPVCDKHLIGRR